MTEDRRFVHTMYFGVFPDHKGDYLGTLMKVEGKWILEYRFRHYSEESTGPFDGKDKKNWYEARMKDGSDESLRLAKGASDKVFASMPLIHKETIDFQCYNDDPKFFFELASRPWAHVKMEPADAQP